jgi:integrase
MANTNVSLVWRCKTESGWQRFPALYGKSHLPRPGVVLIDGKERHRDHGYFQLRYYDAKRKTIFETVSALATEALAALKRREALLGAKALLEAVGSKAQVEEPAAAGANRISLIAAKDKFVQAAEDRGSVAAAGAYRLAVEDFLKITGRLYVDELVPEDMQTYHRVLRSQEQSDRTIYNRHKNVKSFFRYLKLDVKLLAPATPKYEEALPEIYTPEEIRDLFAATTPELLRAGWAFDETTADRLLLTWELMLTCGLREQEAMYLEWSQIDFKNKVLRVKANPRFKFKVKDKEQRDIPMGTELVERLRAHYKSNPFQRLVCGTINDEPNDRMWAQLKIVVNRAGLQCKVCETCTREKDPQCGHWWLHKFRATCITMWLRSKEMGGAGWDVRTVMKFSGHASLDVVLRYLRPAEDSMVQQAVDTIRWRAS